jgi:hypothetical protein
MAPGPNGVVNDPLSPRSQSGLIPTTDAALLSAFTTQQALEAVQLQEEAGGEPKRGSQEGSLADSAEHPRLQVHMGGEVHAGVLRAGWGVEGRA